jgi:hypothetical protein
MFFFSGEKKPDKKPQKSAPQPNGWLNSKELEPPKQFSVPDDANTPSQHAVATRRRKRLKAGKLISPASVGRASLDESWSVGLCRPCHRAWFRCNY